MRSEYHINYLMLLPNTKLFVLIEQNEFDKMFTNDEEARSIR